VGPREIRPLARLASALAVLLVLDVRVVVVVTASGSSASAADIDRPLLNEVQQAERDGDGHTPSQVQTPASSPEHVILGELG